jgi:hypothetical protein
VCLHRALGNHIAQDYEDVGTPTDLDTIICSKVLFPSTFSHTFCVLASDVGNENDT